MDQIWRSKVQKLELYFGKSLFRGFWATDNEFEGEISKIKMAVYCLRNDIICLKFFIMGFLDSLITNLMLKFFIVK